MIGARVGVVGGGLAGITAAVALQEAGAQVEVFETRPWLGGATHSFRRADLMVDNGQHVFLRCCSEYRRLLDRLGMSAQVRIQDRFEVDVLSPDSRPPRLRRAALPGPLHMVPALARYRLLPAADRLRAVRAALALRSLDPADPALDGRSAGGWLAAHGQRERGRRALWEVLLMAALNSTVDEAALGPAAMVLRTALLGRSDAADIGVAAVPLGRLHGQAARRVIERRGGQVHLRTRILGIEPGLKLVPASTGRLAMDAIVVAVPHQAAASLVPAEAAPDRDRWHGLGASPIVNVHLVYDRPVTDLPFAAAVDSPVQWMFDRGASAGLAGGQYLAVSVSAADHWIGMPTAELRDVFVSAMERLLPAARAARVDDVFVTRERAATFRQTPGSGALRPSARTHVPGLFLAGAWTATGWPDTMEGAVRSGLTAARLALRHLAGEVRR